MKNVRYVYTVGMDESEIEDHLQSRHTGVLAVADDGDAYAVPISYRYEDGRLLLRLAEEGGSRKLSALDGGGRATFLVFDSSGDRESWSVVMEGRVVPDDVELDATELNESFPPLRVFGESVEDVAVHVREFDVDEVTARRTEDA